MSQVEVAQDQDEYACAEELCLDGDRQRKPLEGDDLQNQNEEQTRHADHNRPVVL